MKSMKEPLDTQVIEFFSNCGSDHEVVIGVLRYGAHLPHLYQNACMGASVEPRRIPLILSHMLGFFPLSFYEDKDFLVVDDTVYEGTEMTRVLALLTEDYGVPRSRIRTATLVSHEQSKFLPDCPSPPRRLPDGEYIAWKEELATVVRRDIRPTERDHPLYYLEGESLQLNQFLSVIEQYGNVHPVGDDWDAPVFRLSMTIDLAGMGELGGLPGLELEQSAKIRFYWRPSPSGFQLTVAPIAFARLNVEDFVPVSAVLAKRLGLEDAFFSDMASAPVKENGKMLFYFATRTLSALVMLRLFGQIAQSLRQYDPTIHCIPAETVDGFVDYVFPEEYKTFYAAVFNNLGSVVSQIFDGTGLPFGEKWAMPKRLVSGTRKDPLLPQIYEILEYVTRECDPAIWDGTKWSPLKDDYRGIPVKDIVKEFCDSTFVSAALDELLDSGLLRARDEAVDAQGGMFERRVLPGGEYNAVHVSRIADTLRCRPAPIDPQLAMEEACELWGPY